MSAPAATLPGALLVGPMKCGTSWIHSYFEDRGDVCLPAGVKETFYFDRYFERGPDWYAGHFRGFAPERHRLVTEVAPSVFPHTATAPARIRDQLGDIPVVITLRDPVRRAWSHYRHLRRGYTRKPIAEAVREHPLILSASRYSEHIPVWQAHFSAVTVLRLEDLRAAPAAYEAALCAALGLPAKGAGFLRTERVNEATEPSSWYLARAGHLAADGLRRAGLYGAVTAAKRLGLKRLFFGGAARGEGIAPDATALLERELGDERARYDAPVPRSGAAGGAPDGPGGSADMP